MAGDNYFTPKYIYQSFRPTTGSETTKTARSAALPFGKARPSSGQAGWPAGSEGRARMGAGGSSADFALDVMYTQNGDYVFTVTAGAGAGTKVAGAQATGTTILFSVDCN